MDFTITDRALERIKNVAVGEGVSFDKDVLRIGVKSGGCSGLAYDLGWDSTVNEDDEVILFDGFRAVVDLKSFLYLAGTELDFTDGLDGKGFHFNNPLASRTCACGESFAV